MNQTKIFPVKDPIYASFLLMRRCRFIEAEIQANTLIYLFEDTEKLRMDDLSYRTGNVLLQPLSLNEYFRLLCELSGSRVTPTHSGIDEKVCIPASDIKFVEIEIEADPASPDIVIEIPNDEIDLLEEIVDDETIDVEIEEMDENPGLDAEQL